MNTVISCRSLGKSFRVHEKEPGLIGSLRSLVSRRWKERDALSEVSFECAAGEIVGLVGANGAGKTTLVKILSGIIKADSGQASVLGFDPWQRPNEFRRQISLIMGQKAQLWWDLPAADCFLLLREIYQIDRRDFSLRLEELSETLEVAHLQKIQIRRLSLGERMKMELIAALLHRPSVIFLDEPTIGLDITAQKAVRKFLLEYRERYRPSMILTSHYMEDIEELCPRIVIMRAGRIVYDGLLESVMRQHAAHKVLTFQLDGGASDSPLALAVPGEVLERSAAILRVRVERSQVPQAVTSILKTHQVTDISVGEEEIATVIESIMRNRRSAA